MMNNNPKQTKILSQLNSDNANIRKRAIRKTIKIINDEIINQLILMLQVDEKEKVREQIIDLFNELPKQTDKMEKKIIAILEKVSENEPNANFRKKAKKVLKKRLNKNKQENN